MNGPIVVLIVLDAFGVTTLEYLLDHFIGQVQFPNLSRLGLHRVLQARFHFRFEHPIEHEPGTYATALDQASATPDSVIGHREMCGVIDHRTYDLFPNGFDQRFVHELERRIKRRLMFNQMAGGVEAIERHAQVHAQTGHPILYASKCDPLAQIAMDEAVIPVAEQHQIVDTALAVALEMGMPISRVIGRSFVHRDGEYARTANRHDAVLALPGPTLVDVLRAKGVRVVSVGKPSDLVNTTYDREFHLANRADLDPALDLRFVHPKGKDTNPFTIQGIVNAIAEARANPNPNGTFVFANCVDTDSLWGHTRDVEGAIRCVEEFDRVLPHVEQRLESDDLLMITADHGMENRSDYGYHHSEPVPLLARFVDEPSFHLQTGSKGLTEVGSLVAQRFACADDFREVITHVRAS